MPRRFSPAASAAAAARKPASGRDFLAVSREDLQARGVEAADILLISGDAYVDHPAFGAALLGRWLEAHGFTVAILAQPRWDSAEDFLRIGRPRLFAGVTSGALDSMLAHYTAFRKKRSDDAYTPGGRAGARPNRAAIVYANRAREAFPGLPVILGGVECSLRRLSHYDFWSDSLRRSILLDAKADLLIYGMAERAILEAARRLRDFAKRAEAPDASGAAPPPSATAALRGIRGTAWAVSGEPQLPEGARAESLPSHEEILAAPRRLIDATLAAERQMQECGGAAWLIQRAGPRAVVIAPPAAPLAPEELSALYALPFQRRAHPSYSEPVPAVESVQFSVTSHRGCAAGCVFCALASHQGRRIVSREAESIENEVASFTRHPDFRGAVSDIGGPSANMWGARCAADPEACKRASCLHPGICPHFREDQRALAALLRRIARLPGIRSVRVASGVRHDLALQDREYTKILIREFTGGQIKLAPEHLCDDLLATMRKPPFRVFEEFLTVFERESGRAGREQFVIPYLMSAFPGCTEDHMRRLAEWLRRRGWKPRQVQCFIPLPGTLAAAMFWAGMDERGRRIPVARTDAERLRQHHILVSGPESSPRSKGRRQGANPPKSPPIPCNRLRRKD